MSRTILTVVAIVAIATMMGVATVAPAYAAPSEKANKDKDVTIFNDVRNTQSGGLGDPLGHRDICGFGDTRINWTKIKTTTGTLWDNSHFKINISSERTYYAPVPDDEPLYSGEVIGVETVNSNEQGFFPEDGPVTIQENTKLKCLNGEKGGTSHSGSTDVYKDGKIVHGTDTHHN